MEMISQFEAKERNGSRHMDAYSVIWLAIGEMNNVSIP
jgi:hypothetical protein